MVRARFEISTVGFLHAFACLTDGLRSYRLDLEPSASRSDAAKELGAIGGLGSAIRAVRSMSMTKRVNRNVEPADSQDWRAVGYLNGGWC